MSGQSNQQAAQSERNQTIASLLERKYGAWLGRRYFEIDSRIEGPVINVTILLRDADKSFYYPIEGRINFGDQDLTVENAKDFLLDFMDAYVEEFLSGGEETYLTLDWSTYDCDGIELQMRGQILNLRLEAMADELMSRPDTLN
jgi:hypothetical protein